MPKFRRLTESEAAVTQQWLQGLKAELERVVPGKSGPQATTNDYLQWLEWVQYEGISLDPNKVSQFTIFPVLLLIAEHLQTSFGFTLFLSDELLVLQHDRIEGCVPLELLAFRPTQSPDGRWLDEDDPIDPRYSSSLEDREGLEATAAGAAQLARFATRQEMDVGDDASISERNDRRVAEGAKDEDLSQRRKGAKKMRRDLLPPLRLCASA